MARYYLIESTGEKRQVWAVKGDSLEAAKNQVGKRHVVVVGDGLANGQTLTRGELHAAVQSGRIRAADGSDARALA